ncbi:unnamed protein product [Bemisia tabaci]|uniref:Tubulin polyglutamylase TTLL4 n=1 Tax=Bemisia tabaci TaxID=7038 RepID=A0A9P0AFT0_BEMTA|nr:unnamed protein product [Bemisia tabaci]
MASSPKVTPSVALCTNVAPDINKNLYCNLKLPYRLDNKTEKEPELSKSPSSNRYSTLKYEYLNRNHGRRRSKSEGVDLDCLPPQLNTNSNCAKESKHVDRFQWKHLISMDEFNHIPNNRSVDVGRLITSRNDEPHPFLTISLKRLKETSNSNQACSKKSYINTWNQEEMRETRSASRNRALKNVCNGSAILPDKATSHLHQKNHIYDEILLRDMKIEERYRKEMEVLRCKLHELQGVDAKRMRKQNESDIFVSVSSLASANIANAPSESKRFGNISSASHRSRAVLPAYPNNECMPNCSLREEGQHKGRPIQEEEISNGNALMMCFEDDSRAPLSSSKLPIPNTLYPLDDMGSDGFQSSIVSNISANCSKKSKSCTREFQWTPLERQCKSTKFEEFSSPSTDSGSQISACDEAEMQSISAHVKINRLEHGGKNLIIASESASSSDISVTQAVNATCSSSSGLMLNGNEPMSQPHPALRGSLFTHVPPYIKFSSHNVKGPDLPPNVQKLLKWKLSTITPVIVRYTILNSGFKLVRKSNEWTGTWGKHMKSVCFKTLKDYQKLNHFPGSFQIGRKDRLWKNFSRLMNKFGKKEFGFSPKTYVLPQDTKLLRSAWERHCGKEKWIIKPPASARGTGIKVINKWGHIPRKVPLVVQKYIDKPYLINSTKFDLRLYVLVTSVNPLKAYMYDNGLVRFASVKYSSDAATLNERYMHLTNYSINKESCQYTQNQDADSCEGHKWTLKTLWSYLEREHKVDVSTLWASLVDVVIKTLICGESSIHQLTQANLPSRYCSYELFGIDILFDQVLKPWLLEVNISPSLHSSSPLDLAVKGPLVKDLMNIVGFQIPPKLSGTSLAEVKKALGIKSSLCHDKRLFTTLISNAEREKQMAFTQMESREDYLDSILEDLTPDDVRHLVLYEDELTQLGSFQKVFPTPTTYEYHNFFEAPRYYNKLFDAWEVRYHKNRSLGVELLESKCKLKIHLDVSQINFNTTKGQGKRKKLGLVRNFNILWKSQGRIPRNFIFKTKISGEARKKIVSMHELTQVPQKFSFIFDPILTSAVFNASK